MYRNHSTLNRILEGGDISYHQDNHMFEYFGGRHVIPGPSHITVKSMVRNWEPTQEESMFVRWLQSWMESNEPLNVGRFQGVRAVSYDMMPSVHFTGYDLRIEFMVDSVEAITEPSGQDSVWPHDYTFGQTTGGLEPNYLAEYEPRRKDNVIRKKKEHFDKDLFEI